MFRTCDLWVWHLSSHEGSPWIELFWPQKERDRAVASCVTFLKRFGKNYQLFADVTGEYSSRGDEPLRLAFPQRERPATRMEEREGTAIFSLEGRGDRRLISIPPTPVRAVWKTIKDKPYLSRRHNRKREVISEKVVYAREGWVWQAEEVKTPGGWERCFGFVGKYRTEAVPAEEIEFPSPPRWARWSDGLDARIEAPGPKEEGGMVRFSIPRLGEPLPVSLHLWNRTGHDLSIPTSLCQRDPDGGLALLKGVKIQLLYSETWKAGICVKNTEVARTDEGWTLMPGVVMPRYESASPLETLGPARSRRIFTVVLNHLFKIEKTKGWYKIRISYLEEGSNAACGGPVELEILIGSRK